MKWPIFLLGVIATTRTDRKVIDLSDQAPMANAGQPRRAEQDFADFWSESPTSDGSAGDGRTTVTKATVTADGGVLDASMPQDETSESKGVSRKVAFTQVDASAYLQRAATMDQSTASMGVGYPTALGPVPGTALNADSTEKLFILQANYLVEGDPDSGWTGHPLYHMHWIDRGCATMTHGNVPWFMRFENHNPLLPRESRDLKKFQDWAMALDTDLLTADADTVGNILQWATRVKTAQYGVHTTRKWDPKVLLEWYFMEHPSGTSGVWHALDLAVAAAEPNPGRANTLQMKVATPHPVMYGPPQGAIEGLNWKGKKSKWASDLYQAVESAERLSDIAESRATSTARGGRARASIAQAHHHNAIPEVMELISRIDQKLAMMARMGIDVPGINAIPAEANLVALPKGTAMYVPLPEYHRKQGGGEAVIEAGTDVYYQTTGVSTQLRAAYKGGEEARILTEQNAVSANDVFVQSTSDPSLQELVASCAQQSPDTEDGIADGGDAGSRLETQAQLTKELLDEFGMGPEDMHELAQRQVDPNVGQALADKLGDQLNVDVGAAGNVPFEEGHGNGQEIQRSNQGQLIPTMDDDRTPGADLDPEPAAPSGPAADWEQVFNHPDWPRGPGSKTVARGMRANQPLKMRGEYSTGELFGTYNYPPAKIERLLNRIACAPHGEPVWELVYSRCMSCRGPGCKKYGDGPFLQEYGEHKDDKEGDRPSTNYLRTSGMTSSMRCLWTTKGGSKKPTARQPRKGGAIEGVWVDLTHANVSKADKDSTTFIRVKCKDLGGLQAWGAKYRNCARCCDLQSLSYAWKAGDLTFRRLGPAVNKQTKRNRKSNIAPMPIELWNPDSDFEVTGESGALGTAEGEIE